MLERIYLRDKREAERLRQEVQGLEKRWINLGQTMAGLGAKRDKAVDEINGLQLEIAGLEYEITAVKRELAQLRAGYGYELSEAKSLLALIREKQFKAGQEATIHCSELEAALPGLISVLKSFQSTEVIGHVYKVNDLLQRIRRMLQAIKQAPDEASKEKEIADSPAGEFYPWIDWRDWLESTDR
jgi:chromosome segregation ATPase